jgi:heterodisulfide reductase subunit B
VKPEATRQEYAFFPGCMARLKLPQVERSVRALLEDLGVGIKDEERFTCCPDPVVFRSGSREDWLSLAARNLSLDSNLPIVTLCPGCASSLSEARHMLEEDEELASSVAARLEKTGLKLGLPTIRHFLKVLSDPAVSRDIAGKITRKFDGLKAGTHYGCHLVRPSSAVHFENPEKPESLDRLLSLAGARPVDYEDKYLCCGRPSIDEATSAAIVEHKLKAMRAAGCEVLIVACPFCFEQFDLGQAILKRKGEDFDIPVLYISQFLGLAMGRTPEEMGLELHRTKPDRLL